MRIGRHGSDARQPRVEPRELDGVEGGLSVLVREGAEHVVGEAEVEAEATEGVRCIVAGDSGERAAVDAVQDDARRRAGRACEAARETSSASSSAGRWGAETST